MENWFVLAIPLMLLASVATARRHHSSGWKGAGGEHEAGDRGPAWQARKNDRTNGTDLLDWSRDPRRVDPKVYEHKPGRYKCAKDRDHHFTYSMSGQLEGQEWAAGLVKGEQVEPKSKAQLVVCDLYVLYNHPIDAPTDAVLDHLVKHDIMLERDYPMERCADRNNCMFARRARNCTTYKLDEPYKAEGLNGPISGKLSGRVERLLREYGPMAVFLNFMPGIDDDGFLKIDPGSCSPVHHLPTGNFLLVGYGRTNDGVGYFKFKTSRGADWGHNGFGYFKYTSHDGPCGHLYGKINLWKIKPCKQTRRQSRQRSRLRHRKAHAGDAPSDF